jgi:hypothetical protein
MFLELIDDREIDSAKELQDFFGSDEIGQAEFEDIEKLKKWISEGTNCIWHIFKLNGENGTIYIDKYIWEDD